MSEDDKKRLGNLKAAFRQTTCMDCCHQIQNHAFDILFIGFAMGEITAEEYNDWYSEIAEWAVPNPQLC